MERSNPFHLGSQTYRLLERLYEGPVSNVEIAHEMRILRYSGRMAEVRQKGHDILATKVPDRPGVYVYQLVGR